MTLMTPLRIYDGDKGPGTATVHCPRRGKPTPLLVCEACAMCVHVSRPSDPRDWVVICAAPG